ncbi:uncharacterized protein LOC142239267 [Haematobia irritans]|uniref:uncharacterized protein LOC142239267 n=1 Tax=Haematobia irritans TaxID=7368 RepID=UPI003F4FEB35
MSPNRVRQEVPSVDPEIIILSTDSSDEEAMEGISLQQAIGESVPGIHQKIHNEPSEDDVATIPRSEASEITTENEDDDYYFRENLYGQEDDVRSPMMTQPQMSSGFQQENGGSHTTASSTSSSPCSAAHAFEYEESLPTPPRRPKQKWCAWTAMTYETEEHNCYEWNISVKMLVKKENYMAKKPPAQIEQEKTPRIGHLNKPAIAWHSPESDRSWVTVSELSPERSERPPVEVPIVTMSRGEETDGIENEQPGIS